MIKYQIGDLLSVKEGIIAHGVNCQGVMGSGVALAIRRKHPEAYLSYIEYIENFQNLYKKEFSDQEFETKSLLGCMQITHTENENLFIANCFTQDFYGTERRHVNYEAVAQSFSELELYTYLGTLHIPKIGAGLAGGDWKVISAIIESEFKGDVVCWEL